MTFLVFLTLPLLLAATVDAGYLNQTIAGAASRLSGHSIQFRALRTHLLSGTPWLEIDDLRIANPAGFPTGDLAHVRRLSAILRPARIWRGSFGVDQLRLDGVALWLIRYGPNHNNWTTPHHHANGPAFAFLRDVRDFQVTRSWLRFRDTSRDLDISGPFDIGEADGGFRFAGAGSYLACSVSAQILGGSLRGSAVDRPFPFQADLTDGRTQLFARGASVQPFDMTAYQMIVRGSGPNLADVGYLFHLIPPNTAPFALQAKVISGGGIMRVNALDIRTGSSQVEGSIWSDHRGPRRDIRAWFRAGRLDRKDVDAMLMSLPPRAIARDHSGAAPPSAPSRFLISPAPLGVARLRAADFDFDISVRQLTGYALPFLAIKTRVDLDHGLLSIPRFEAMLFGGTVSGQGEINAKIPVPQTRIRTHLTGVRMPSGGGTAGRQAVLDGGFNIWGTGPSLHAAAAHASGTAWLRLSSLDLPRATRWMIGGDLLRAASASLGPNPAGGATTIEALHFEGRDGHLVSTDLAARSGMGLATGNASIDLGTENFCAYLMGKPFNHRLFQVAAPFRVSGPWLRPRVAILPGRKASALGLRGKAGLLLTPVTALLPIHAKPSHADSCV